ncbi:hypothetical protein [Shewanella atlantica]|uniref:Uncharacterized protein n=1 Tax=Shewanella atlantica TaxID=271099 RepID=A0A431WGU6_9GAMM|nr:hypothetical protein [Shewanella atlantica]RTR34699.1 hypothetical protein EKG39_03300 [Shewanella atlantica]
MLESNYNCTTIAVRRYWWNLIRRDKQPSVDTAASFGFKDETAERPGMASQRLAEVSAHERAAGYKSLLKV